mgnify:CR=1 FL=1|jgi:hypothetical protein
MSDNVAHMFVYVPIIARKLKTSQLSATTLGLTTRGAPIIEEWPDHSRPPCTSALTLNVPLNRRFFLGVIL